MVIICNQKFYTSIFMQSLVQKCRNLALVAGILAALLSGQALANGAIGEHVNNLQGHLEQYTEEVDWLITKVDGIVDTYETSGQKAAKVDAVLEHWEAVDFHAAIETNYVPVYASIWQGLFGVKQAIDNNAPIAVVREEQAKLEQALWQALGAVKLAAQYQQKGLLAQVKPLESESTTPPETLEEIKHQLDRVVAKYAEQLPDAAKNIVHDTYLHRFEGVEGLLIAQDAALVEGLEKDFNVTLPQALDRKVSVDEVQQVVQAMQAKLDKAKSLLLTAEKEQKDVF
jgi:DNA anti-recombination protein RmuC